MSYLNAASVALLSAIVIGGCNGPRYHVTNQTECPVRIRITPGYQPPFSLASTSWCEAIVSPGEKVTLDRNRKPLYPHRQMCGPIALETYANNQYTDIFIRTNNDLSITITALNPPQLKVIDLTTGYPARVEKPDESPWKR